MRQTEHHTTSQAASPWAPLVVGRFLERNSVDLPGKDKDAKLKKLGEDLKAIKELEDWSPKTMRSVAPKSSYRRVADLRGLTGDVTCLRVLPGGEVIAGDSRGRLVSWIEGNSGAWEPEVLSDDTTASQLDVLPDRRVLVSNDSGVIEVYAQDRDMAWKRQASLHMETDLVSFQATPDGRMFAIGEDNSITWWREESVGQWQTKMLGMLDEDIKVVRATPDEKLVVVDARSRMFWISRGESGEWSQCKGQRPDFNGVRCAEVISSNLIIVGSRDFKVHFSIPDSTYEDGWLNYTLVGHKGAITCLSAFTKETIVSGSADNEAIVWKWKTNGTEPGERLIGHTGALTCVQLLPDERVVSGSQDGTLRVWSRQPDGKWHSEVLDTRTWSEGLSFRLGRFPQERSDAAVTHMQVLPDGRIVSAGAGGRVQVWDGKPVKPK